MSEGYFTSRSAMPLPDPAATEQLGRKLAATLPKDGHAVMWLNGDLGAGKTTLARSMLRALGVTGPIRSPTYTLIERYALPTGAEAAHLDLYRISDPEELDYLALDELAINARLWMIEWPQHGAGRLPAADVSVSLNTVGAGREVNIVAASKLGECWLTNLFA